VAQKQSDEHAYRWHSEWWHKSNQMNMHTDGRVDVQSSLFRSTHHTRAVQPNKQNSHY